MSYSTPNKHDGSAVLFAVAELFVIIITFLPNGVKCQRAKNKSWNTC